MKVYAKPLGKNKLNRNRAIEIPIPDSITCPHCNIPHEELEPERSFYNNDSDITDVCLECPEISFLIYRCPECQKVFYVHINCEKCEIISYYPPLIEHHEFPPLVHEISSDFIKIFKQAETAKQMNLDEVCYPAYRKALELFIKNFLNCNDISVEDKDTLADYINKLKLNIFTIPADKVRDDGNKATHTPNFNSNDIEQNLIYFVNMLTKFQEGIKEGIYKDFSQLLKEKEQRNPKRPVTPH